MLNGHCRQCSSTEIYQVAGKARGEHDDLNPNPSRFTPRPKPGSMFLGCAGRGYTQRRRYRELLKDLPRFGERCVPPK